MVPYSKGKTREITQTTTGYERCSKKRISTADAMQALGNSIDAGLNSLSASIQASAITLPLSTPERQTAAVNAIEKNEAFDDDMLTEAVSLVMDNPKMATMYLVLKSDSAHSLFLRKCLNKHALGL